MKTYPSLHLKVISLLFLSFLLKNCAPNDYYEEKGECILTTPIKDATCRWKSIGNSDSLVKVTIVLDTIKNEQLSIDSVISIYNKEYTKVTSYHVDYRKQDSVFRKEIKDKSFALVSSYKESYLKADKEWVLNEKETMQFDLVLDLEITERGKYIKNDLIDSSIYLKNSTYSVQKEFSKNELGTIVLEKEDSTISNDSITFYHSKYWSLFGYKGGENFYGVWSDSTPQKIEFYSEEVQDGKKNVHVHVEFVPDANNHNWLLDNIESIYKPLLKKVDREYFLDGNKMDYSCLLNEDKEICYESYRKDGVTTYNVGTSQEGNDFKCNGVKTFARISISIRRKNNN